MSKFTINAPRNVRIDYNVFSCWGELDDVCVSQTYYRSDVEIANNFMHMGNDAAKQLIAGLTQSIKESEDMDAEYNKAMLVNDNEQNKERRQ